MAVILGFSTNPSVGEGESVHVTSDFDLFGSDWLGPVLAYWESTRAGTPLGSSQLPVAAAPRSITGAFARSFADDFYHQIHMAPAGFALGNMTSAQTREVTLWNSHLTPQLLSSVAAIGDEGLVLNEPQAAPTYFQPLEERTYTLNITTNGPPVIDAAYQFLFENDTPRLTVTGKRVVLWPFIPQTKHQESLEWKTDVIPSFNNEQRIALRSAPRQSISYDFQLDPRQFSRAKAISTQWAHRVYGVPVWAEATRVGALSAGAMSILLDTSDADYRDADLVAIWESDEKYEAVETTTIAAGQINLKLGVVGDYTAAYVMPVRFARTRDGMSFNRGAHLVTTAKASFQVTSNKDIGAATGWPTHRGKDVLTERTVLVGDLSERISRAVEEFDNGSGPISVDPVNSWVRATKTVTFDTLTRAERWAMRQWVHSRRGKQKGFWLPSWNTDFEILLDVGELTASLTIRPIGYPTYYGVKDIMIALKNGTLVFARVIGGVTGTDGNEVLGLDAAIGTAFLAADVDFACFMSHVRFDSDRIDIKHDSAGRATMSVAVVETPEA